MIILIAGRVAVQTAIGQASFLEIASKGIDTVRDAAQVVANHHAEYRRHEGERIYLAPLGLTTDSLARGPHSLSDAAFSQLRYKLQTHDIRASAIVTGLDADGWPHIYTIGDPGLAHCEDMAGFAVIGSGQHHARSQFMTRGYGPDAPIWETLQLVYAAKRKAETAPGVGKGTDMGGISPLGYVSFPDDEGIMLTLKQGYERMSKAEREEWEKGKSALLGKVKEINKREAAQQAGAAGALPEDAS